MGKSICEDVVISRNDEGKSPASDRTHPYSHPKTHPHATPPPDGPRPARLTGGSTRARVVEERVSEGLDSCARAPLVNARSSDSILFSTCMCDAKRKDWMRLLRLFAQMKVIISYF